MSENKLLFEPTDYTPVLIKIFVVCVYFLFFSMFVESHINFVLFKGEF
jgi:hypothetical protein